MSWSLSTTVTVDEGESSFDISFKAAAALKSIDRASIGNQQCLVERDEQIEAAIKLATKLIRQSGFVGAREISISLSGHANKEHKKDDGWANEFISLSTYVTNYRE